MDSRLVALVAFPVAVACSISTSACTDAGVDDGADTATSTGESGDATDETETTETEDTGETETGEDPTCEGPWDLGQTIPLPELPAGDPEAGYEALLTQDYVSCGIPWEVFGLAEGVLGTEEPLPGREGKNAEVGHSWNVVTNPDGSEMVVSNCLQCHAGWFNGELIVGLGKANADFTSSFADTVAPLPDLPETSDANVAFNKFKARVASIGTYSTMATIGANPAVMYAIVLLSHRDPDTLEWLDEPHHSLDAGVIVPADPPPWWRTRKKASHFTNGMSRGDHRGTMVLASSLCTDGVDEASALVDYFDDIQAYVMSLEAPEYPFTIDLDLAAEGEELFECNCSGCHGTYAEDPEQETYPNLLIPTEVIGTDPLFAESAGEGGVYHYLEEWFNSSYYGTVSEIITNDPEAGYTAPPLDGIWATAPFLHNGSVPSLALVLDSTARPTYWRRVDYDSTNFDEDAVGWPWQEAGPQAEAAEDQRKFIHDATLPGYANTGHTFGDHLSDEERRAVLEYLKTL